MQWPEADEDCLRAAAEAYEGFARDLPVLKDDIAQLVAYVRQTFAGDAADAFAGSMKSLISGTGDDDWFVVTQKSASDMADFVLKISAQVEYTKWMMVGQLVQLAASITLGWVLA